MSEAQRGSTRRRKEFAEFSLAEALGVLGWDTLTRWEPTVVERAPSELLQQYLQRIEATFDLRGSEASRMYW